MMNTQEQATWGELLHSAVRTPGKLLAAYTAFHNYSMGNALLALEQCISRDAAISKRPALSILSVRIGLP